MFRKVLIANRGEIAVRIIKACQELKIQTVAVYSEVDTRARHTLLADEAVNLGPANPAESYLNLAKIITAAKGTGCEAIHPGYGFLSENAAFAEAVQAAGLTFIGPSVEAIRTMGDKTAARRLMQDAGVPVVPGFDGQDPQADFAAAAKEIGYPILVKAAAGGGGKGMRIVHTPDDLAYALEAAQREAQNAFGDPHLYLEKYLPNPRHIEFQILADQHGTILHLFERECSIQRRYQKIIEETPSPFLDAPLRQKMAEAAIAAAAAVGYVNAGTVEFLVVADPRSEADRDEKGDFYFLEMNTRLQVEHPITEAVTGVDLVQAQLLVAGGEPLPMAQADIGQRGHAIECRIYAEDPANNFLPASGPILQVVEPTGVGVRVDSGLECGAEVTVHYDPLLAKLIVQAANREAAIRKMEWALQRYVILGLTTNIPFLRAVINHPEFMAGRTNTHFLENHFPSWSEDQPAIPDLALIAAALCDQLSALQIPPGPPQGGENEVSPSGGPGGGGDPHSPWRISDDFRIGVKGGRA